MLLICFEIMLLSINLIFIFSSIFFDDFLGQIYSFFMLTIAASESALGLTILVIFIDYVVVFRLLYYLC
jgi:NADH-quinone oxidoreductase subunit K